MTAVSPQREPRTDLAAMSIRELLAELTRLQDRANAGTGRPRAVVPAGSNAPPR